MPDLAPLDVHHGLATITMNRPDRRNALSVELIDALNDAIGRVERDDQVRCLVLAGAGRCFCAGMDLRGVLDDADAMGGMLRGLSLAMRRLRRLPVPTIARAHGAAVGGGCGLMVVTDFAITHPEAKVGYPEVSLGVCPAVVAPWLMRRIGAGPARAMLLTGGTIDGTAAHACGVATHLCELDDLDETVRVLADGLLAGGPHATAVTKHWLNELDGSLEDAPLDRAAALSAEVIAGPEAQERLAKLFGH